MGFILAIGEAVRGKKIRDDDIQRSEAVKRLLEMLVKKLNIVIVTRI